MRTKAIGSLQVSVVGLGCNNFGWRIDENETARVVAAAIDAGITLLDTADIYGGAKSEEFLGRALEASGHREKVVLATKFGMEVDAARKGASPAYVRQACEDSLRRLRTDRIDLYQLHEPDPKTPIGDTLAALDALVREGKVREIGCSNFDAAQLREAREAVKAGAARFVSVQNELSLLHHRPEEGTLAEVTREGLAFLPYFPLASGALTGKYLGGGASSGRLAAGGKLADRYLAPEHQKTVRELQAFARSRGHTLAELSFAWLLHHEQVASVIAGATSPEQVRANASAAGWVLSAEEAAAASRLAGAS